MRALVRRGVRGVCALDAGRREGWQSAVGGLGRARSVLVAEPEVVFEGGLGAVQDALGWLKPDRRADSMSRVVVGYLGYELARELAVGRAAPWLARSDAARAASLSLPGSLSESHRASAERSRPARADGRTAPAIPDPLGRGPGTDLGPTSPVWLAGYRAAYYFDPTTRTGHVAGDDARAVERLARAVSAIARDPLAHATQPGLGLSDPLAAGLPDSSDEAFRSGVRSVLDWIRAGDVYQVNLSRQLSTGPIDADGAAAIYAYLCTAHPAPFNAFVDTGQSQVVSNSPERFLRVVDRAIETCPIKGTRPRGRTRVEDRALAADLVGSAKDHAEHVMIVDLERNDLGKVCRVGSVHVPLLARLRRFATVQHLISSVRGELRPDVDAIALIEAMFPGGSITGAPKVRAMQIIAELERSPRGVYTGAIGVLDAGGGVDLSIAIRTATVAGGTLSLHVGGGIVADSCPQDELRETYHKARAFSRLWEA